MTKLAGGDWVVEALRAEGVSHVFGIPGVHNLAIYDGLLRRPGITHILARHEQGAAFMADGYARSSGRPGVVVVTTGPGATNALTPLVESYAGSIPVVIIMSDVASHLVGRDLGALHEVPNQIDCFRPVCRMAETLTSAADIPATIAGAFDLLRTGRPGPIAISIPNDFLGTSVEAETRRGDGRRPPCHVAEIADAARRLERARRPLLIAGGGVIASGAERELLALARRLDAPVLTTVMGRGSVPEDDPVWHAVLPNKRAAEGVIIDATVIGRMFKPQLGIVGDARDGLARLVETLGVGRATSAWDRARLAELKTAASPRYTREVAGLISTLRRALPREAIVVNDQTGINYWMEWRYPVLAPRTFLYPVGSATLGYAVPAAIGAKIANPDRPVVAVVGDGGFMFSVNELATAVKYRLPIPFIVMNDDRYGAIKWLQEEIFQRWGEADLANPDFPALARAFGARGERLASVDALPAALDAAFKAGGPTLFELNVTVEPPWELK